MILTKSKPFRYSISSKYFFTAFLSFFFSNNKATNPVHIALENEVPSQPEYLLSPIAATIFSPGKYNTFLSINSFGYKIYPFLFNEPTDKTPSYLLG